MGKSWRRKYTEDYTRGLAASSLVESLWSVQTSPAVPPSRSNQRAEALLAGVNWKLWFSNKSVAWARRASSWNFWLKRFSRDRCKGWEWITVFLVTCWQESSRFVAVSLILFLLLVSKSHQLSLILFRTVILSFLHSIVNLSFLTSFKI